MWRRFLVWMLVPSSTAFLGCGASTTPETVPVVTNDQAVPVSVPEPSHENVVIPSENLPEDFSDSIEPANNDTDSSEITAETNPQDMKKLIDHFLFYPTKFPVGNWEPRGLKIEEALFETVDGSSLHGWYCPIATANSTLFYAHGNGGNLSYRAGRIRELQQRLNCNVFIFDYRGYGRSEGVPTATGIIEDSDAALEWLKTKTGLDSKEMIFLGRSLGGAVAADMAHRHGAKALILESTFYSLREISANYVPKTLAKLLVADRLNTAEILGEIDCPVILSHGTIDHVVPYSHGVRLSALAKQPSLFVELPQFDHNDGPPDWYYEQVVEFLAAQSIKP